MALTPVIAGATPSLTLVAMVKLLLKFRAGLKVTPASKADTKTIRLQSSHMPMSYADLCVTAPEVAVVRLPAATFDRVRVAVMLALSTSLATMSIRLSVVSSVYVSSALRVVAVGALLTLSLHDALPILIAGATPSLTLVAMVKLLLKFRAGLKVTPASKVLTSAIAPLALHTPVPAL